MKSLFYFPNWFIGLVLLAILHQITERVLQIRISFIDNYLDPLLLMPVLLHLIRLEINIRNSTNSRRLPAAVVYGYFLIISFTCEYLFPQFNSGFTSNPWDVVCYFLGSGGFMLFMNRDEEVVVT